MANVEILKGEDEIFHSSILGASGKSRGQLIESKIDVLESLASKVSNRRSRRWLNDRLLIELVPRLNVEEIRGLFAPPPWGDDTPLSAFCMTNNGEWDLFRSIDMDTESRIIKSLEKSSVKRKDHVDNEKAAVLNAWHRVDCRTREALRRDSLFNLVERYEERVRAFIKNSDDEEVLVLHVQDPFHRLLLHGVCEVMICATFPRIKNPYLAVLQLDLGDGLYAKRCKAVEDDEDTEEIVFERKPSRL